MSHAAAPLDPLLAPALELAELPVRAERAWADALAHRLVRELETTLATGIDGERDPAAFGQLSNIAEVLGVSIISLVAYSRGKVPKVASKAPDNVSLVVTDTLRRRQ